MTVAPVKSSRTETKLQALITISSSLTPISWFQMAKGITNVTAMMPTNMPAKVVRELKAKGQNIAAATFTSAGTDDISKDRQSSKLRCERRKWKPAEQKVVLTRQMAARR